MAVESSYQEGQGILRKYANLPTLPVTRPGRNYHYYHHHYYYFFIIIVLIVML